jgi:hypothetical protein
MVTHTLKHAVKEHTVRVAAPPAQHVPLAAVAHRLLSLHVPLVGTHIQAQAAGKVASIAQPGIPALEVVAHLS